MSKDLKEIVEEMTQGNSKSGSKNSKRSARLKYNRRKHWLAVALQQMDRATDELLAQNGRVYKREDIEALKSAIAQFYANTDLKVPDLEPPTQEELDTFMDMLTNLKPWEPPSKEELAALHAAIDCAIPSDDEISENAEPDC